VSGSGVARGSGWELRLGDCRDQETGLLSLGTMSVDHIVTDPPYSARTHEGQRYGRRDSAYYDGWVNTTGLKYDGLTVDDVSRMSKLFSSVRRKWALIMTDHVLFPSWEASLDGYTFAPVPIVLEGMTVRLAGDGPSSWTIWMCVNRATGIKDGTKPGAYVGSPGAGPDRASNPVKGHKPEWLMERLILDYTAKGDLVCDPCAGSGTTGVASIKRGRRFIGWEKDEKTFAYAAKRLVRAREQTGFPFAEDAT